MNTTTITPVFTDIDINHGDNFNCNDDNNDETITTIISTNTTTTSTR